MGARMRTTLLILSAVFPLTAFASQDDSEARKVAEQYLKAITGEGDERGKELLLGGLTMDASLFSLENGRILSSDPVRAEKGDLGVARKMVKELDEAAKRALKKLMEGGGGDDLELVELDEKEAAKVMKPTKDKASRLLKKFPVLAKTLRVGKEIYWHPKNAMRRELAKAPTSGQYELVMHRFVVESFEGPRKVPRRWGLKILRFKSGEMDTGWKVLAASDWAAE
jgi:hypothetical protein